MIGNSRSIERWTRRGGFGPVVGLSWLLSVGQGGGVNGMAFIAREAFGFGSTANLLLQLAAGVAYTLAAISSSRLFARTRRLAPALGTRGILAALIVTWGLLYMLPLIARRPSVLCGAYVASFAVSALIWPVVEAFVSGGRQGSDLRRAIGRFNIAWSCGLPIGLLAVSMVLEPAPLEGLAGLGGVITLCAAVAMLLPKEPGTHGTAVVACEPVYRPLLTCFRTLLPLSITLVFVLNPLAPDITSRIGLGTAAGAVLFSVTHVARFGTFVLMQRAAAWHGRWSTPAWASALLAAGVTGALLGGSWPIVLLSLTAFGAATGAIYFGALYYAMAVGRTEVDAGGKHEALIGCGFFVGPTIGAIPLLAGVEEARSLPAIASVTAIAAVLGFAWAARPALQWRRERRSGGGDRS